MNKINLSTIFGLYQEDKPSICVEIGLISEKIDQLEEGLGSVTFFL